VVFSHHHPDHTVNAALFPAARIHDHWAMYVGDRWIDPTVTPTGRNSGRRSGCCALRGTPPRTSPRVASTLGEVFACTHAWWGANGPADDPLGSDAGALHASRELLLSFASVIVPGHGAAFRSDQDTPR
jgi:glyoxylase-like metal-dependent hydrolase (beta-lactamase superfamily II)